MNNNVAITVLDSGEFGVLVLFPLTRLRRHETKIDNLEFWNSLVWWPLRFYLPAESANPVQLTYFVFFALGALLMLPTY